MTKEEHLEKFIERSIPKNLWSVYEQVVQAMKNGFYEGVSFAEKQSKDQLIKRLRKKTS